MSENNVRLLGAYPSTTQVLEKQILAPLIKNKRQCRFHVRVSNFHAHYFCMYSNGF